MPQLGETVTEGTITRWMKSVGDHVEIDEVLFEVSTDKVDSEVPSSATGTLSEIRVQEGETASVGAVIAVISDAGATPVQESATPEPEKAKVEHTPEPQVNTAEVSQDRNIPVPGSAPAGKVLSPIVRKLINENGLDAGAIHGSGIGGRVTREDVVKHLESRQTKGMTGSVKQTPRPEAMPPAKPGEHDTVIPFNKIREKTAEHMIMSKSTSAHTLVAIEVDYANVDAVRLSRKDAFKKEEGISLTYMPFIARALVDALHDFPHANASVGENELIVHRDVNIGIAVDINFEGLLVPVVQNADGLRLRQLSRGIADLAYRARNKKLQADDIRGGTFTITNAGGYGTLVTYPVINQPQVAILSTDGVKKKPVVIELPDGSDAIVVHPVGVLALAWDHRAFDGAYAAAFLARIKEVLETRDWSGEF